MRESFSELRIRRMDKLEGVAGKFAEIAFRNLEFLDEFYYYELVDSTNERAKEICKKFCLFFAEEQTAGKGRLGRKWFSSKGGLYFSITLPAYEVGKLTTISALSVAESIPTARIKWPNDVLIGNLKFSGILGELFRDLAVVGIGINVENEIPAELRDYATNLSKFFSLSREEVFDRVTANFYKNYVELVSGNWKELFRKYRELCITLGKYVKVITPSGEFEGIAELSEDGAIIVGGKKIYVGDCIHLR
ncbi:MAG: biotin--[acetyl-CoA-carboxylase] ligase [Archaeoglobaceae archaeon]